MAARASRRSGPAAARALRDRFMSESVGTLTSLLQACSAVEQPHDQRLRSAGTLRAMRQGISLLSRPDRCARYPNIRSTLRISGAKPSVRPVTRIACSCASSRWASPKSVSTIQGPQRGLRHQSASYRSTSDSVYSA